MIEAIAGQVLVETAKVVGRETAKVLGRVFEKKFDEKIDKGNIDGPRPISDFYNPDVKIEKGLSQERKNEIKNETGWSDNVVDNIDSNQQYEIYKNADLRECLVNDRSCLTKNIDLDYVDPKTGWTNRERMSWGRAPIDAKSGEKIELHHMGQNQNAPFAELCENSEHGDGNDAILHDKNKPSWRRDPAANEQYKQERENHWKTRATMEV